MASLIAVAPLVLWPLAMLFVRGEIRWDYFAFPLAAVVLAYGNDRTKRLFKILYPLSLVAIVYDAMRLVKDVGVTPERLHICDLRNAEIALFGFHGGTVHDWLQPRAWLPLDIVCAIPYGTFIFATLGFATWLYFRSPEDLRSFGWTFLLVNVLGFLTYHVYPAAPPWYFHDHGCTIDLATRASAGPNLERVDAWLGVGYFAALYGRSSDVFGSVPSLHVAYPMMTLLAIWRSFGRFGRGLGLLFLVWMCFAAVYLDHHWIIDIVLGLLYAAAGTLVVRKVVA